MPKGYVIEPAELRFFVILIQTMSTKFDHWPVCQPYGILPCDTQSHQVNQLHHIILFIKSFHWLVHRLLKLNSNLPLFTSNTSYTLNCDSKLFKILNIWSLFRLLVLKTAKTRNPNVVPSSISIVDAALVWFTGYLTKKKHIYHFTYIL